METQRIVEKLQANSDKVLTRIQDLSKIDRLPQEATQIAFKEAQDSLLNDMSHVSKSVIDAQWNMAEDNAANIGSVSAFFGDRDGKCLATRCLPGVMPRPSCVFMTMTSTSCNVELIMLSG